jgi:hypothetical protein
MDFWSFGLLIYEIVLNEKLFGASRNEQGTARVMSRILEEDYNDKIERLPEPYKTIVKKCLVKNAALRVQYADELIQNLGDKGMAASGSTEQTKNLGNSADKKELIPGSITNIPNKKVKTVGLIKDNGSDIYINPPKKNRKWIYASIPGGIGLLILMYILFGQNSSGSIPPDDPVSKDSVISDSVSTPMTVADHSDQEVNNTEQEVIEVNQQPDKKAENKTSNEESRKIPIIEKIEVPQKKTCPDCGGLGTITSFADCIVCGGKKKVKCNFSKYGFSKCDNGSLICNSCQGTGDCKECSGSGDCRTCQGSGKNYQPTATYNCRVCDGSGKCFKCKGSGYCRNCKGNGNEKCSNCDGTGQMKCDACTGSGKGEAKTEKCSRCNGNGII